MELAREEKERIIKETGGLLQEYGGGRDKLIPLLQKLQDKLGYLPLEAMEKVAEDLDMPAVDIYELATFYNQFRLHPPGEYRLKVCMGTACYMVGGEVAMDSLQRRLKIKEGETTLDRKFSLERVACLGCCSLAPVVAVNDRIEGHVTPTRAAGLLFSYQKGNKEKEKGE